MAENSQKKTKYRWYSHTNPNNIQFECNVRSAIKYWLIDWKYHQQDVVHWCFTGIKHIVQQ